MISVFITVGMAVVGL
ncbi:hypothetical protein ACWBUA_003337 [Escherichia coli]